MKILVTGHRGYIGSRLVPTLKDRGHQVAAFEGDVTNLTDWEYNANMAGPSAIIHLAAMNNLRDCEIYPDVSFSNNYLSAHYAAQIARGAGARLIMPTTTTAGEYHTVYEEDRFAATLAIVQMRGLEYSILELATVYGDSPTEAGRGRGVINTWINMGLAKKPVAVFREVASKMRHFVYIGDVVDHVISALDSPAGIYDVWPEERMTMMEAATDIADYLDVKATLADAPEKLYPVELRDEILFEPVRLMRGYAWTSFYHGMRRTADALSKNKVK
jgi:nucleoside-diphosphate-sugar epimerase